MTNEEWSAKLKQHWAELSDAPEIQVDTDYIRDYIENELKCEVRHDLDTLLEAVQETSDAFDIDQEGLLRFMLANEPMAGTHSYGFHTRYGRAIRDHFSFIYHG